MSIMTPISEVVQLADRILVMGDFRLLAELANSGDYAPTSELVMRAITRATSQPEVSGFPADAEDHSYMSGQ
jgi:hypothetical protein